MMVANLYHYFSSKLPLLPDVRCEGTSNIRLKRYYQTEQKHDQFLFQ